jgi:arginyl-tRNA synthetase
MLIREQLKGIIDDALEASVKEKSLGALENVEVPVIIEKPKLADHGDLACGIALKLAGGAKMPPLKIAEAIAKHVRENPRAESNAITSVAVAPPGFLNFKLGTAWLASSLQEIHTQGENFGRTNLGNGARVNIEYVSANPTGELHIGHGRNAVYGSCLAHLMKFAGYNVEEEFYINDIGEQINALGACAWALYQRRFNKDVPYPETGYPEDSLADYVDSVIADVGDSCLSLSDQEGSAKLGELTKAKSRQQHEDLLRKLGVTFDRWYSETALHQNGKVDDVLEEFRKHGYTYESEGALWLKADELGDQRPRVLRKGTGATTYLANDSAYHLDKYRRGYDLMINVWGADHHGQVPGLKAAMTALGQDANKLEVILTQLVSLLRDGQQVRMSKRKGTVVTLQEVAEEVGVDATRYYLGESNPQNQIGFDLELAKKTSRENPAFYIQYAHARCCAILRRALEPQVNVDKGAEEPPVLTEKQYAEYLEEYKKNASVFEPAFSDDPEIFAHQKRLVMTLQSFPAEINEAAINRQPGRIARFAFDVANDLQKFYEVSRVITDDTAATKASLGLIIATRQVLGNALAVIGVSAPDRM